MRVILLQDFPTASRTLALPARMVWALPLLFVVCIAAAGLGGYRLALAQAGELPADLVAVWGAELSSLAARTDELRENTQREERAYAARVATLQARLLRMEAVGERLAVVAKLDKGEFDFDQAPALGGPFSPETASLGGSEMGEMLRRLATQIKDRERQLDVMEKLLVNRKLGGDVSLAGLPVAGGYISSRFGPRTDPFDGRSAWHKGVDFTASPGSDVFAIASGVVVWAGYDKDYGNLVEIRHSNGYRTRYAHNREYLVKPGDIVKKGQVIAHVGQTGRASGAHLHLEVLRDDRQVDPMQYISTIRGDA
jgi:murein DD-endopeptidase MepM/ murein hydrolase activator NlpD